MYPQLLSIPYIFMVWMMSEQLEREQFVMILENTSQSWIPSLLAWGLDCREVNTSAIFCQAWWTEQLSITMSSETKIMTGSVSAVPRCPFGPSWKRRVLQPSYPGRGLFQPDVTRDFRWTFSALAATNLADNVTGENNIWTGMKIHSVKCYARPAVQSDPSLTDSSYAASLNCPD